MPVEHFKSKSAYRKWNAYRHIHDIPAPNLSKVVIKGHEHKVQHSSLSIPKAKAEERLASLRKDRDTFAYDWRQREGLKQNKKR